MSEVLFSTAKKTAKAVTKMASVFMFVSVLCSPVDAFATPTTSTAVKVVNQSNFSQASVFVSASDIQRMRAEVKKTGAFQQEYLNKRETLDKQLTQNIEVPLPKDAGGGYTHGIHVNNSRSMVDAGILYQISGDEKYARYIRDVLLKYAALYPNLPLHPQRKTDSVISAGKLFWQNLNESVWLVYTIQAYDAIRASLPVKERETIEQGLFRPMVKFLSVDSEDTFNKIHNHATWATCAVGMSGYVLRENEWVEQALMGTDKKGVGGFLKQLQELFSPNGYYNEGPYYQRYALLPFVTFAKAIQVNQPERKIFQFRDAIILKAIDATIQLSYNKLFFPVNDAIKDKGIDSIELVNGVAIAYGLSGSRHLLSIAQQQNKILLTSDGLAIAQALDKGLQLPYEFTSSVFYDGAKGDEGALVVMREKNQAMVFKASAQGMGHGHFDKLNWLFYDQNEEIVSDYGSARFLNIEAKFGGRYLPENKSYASQTVAHNTLVVDETSHFNGDTELGNTRHPDLLYFKQDAHVKITAAQMKNAYADAAFTRTFAHLNLPGLEHPIIIDVLSVKANSPHQFDLPLHYQGHLLGTNFKLATETQVLKPLGTENGYEHLWLKAQGSPERALAQITWLNRNGRFYTMSSVNTNGMKVLFTQIGANDPNFNLRSENAFILRVTNSQQHHFICVLEPHGKYDPVNELTINGASKVSNLSYGREAEIEWVHVKLTNQKEFLLAFNNTAFLDEKTLQNFNFNKQSYQFSGRFKLFELPNKE